MRLGWKGVAQTKPSCKGTSGYLVGRGSPPPQNSPLGTCQPQGTTTPQSHPLLKQVSKPVGGGVGFYSGKARSIPSRAGQACSKAWAQPPLPPGPRPKIERGKGTPG